VIGDCECGRGYVAEFDLKGRDEAEERRWPSEIVVIGAADVAEGALVLPAEGGTCPGKVCTASDGAEADCGTVW
jgi:hypothetical protein